MSMNFDGEELDADDALQSSPRSVGLMQELRLMQCYLMPDETGHRGIVRGVIEKLKLMSDADFAEVSTASTDFAACWRRITLIFGG